MATLMGQRPHLYTWGFPKVGVPPNHPKSIILELKPIVLGIPYFNKPLHYWRYIPFPPKKIMTGPNFLLRHSRLRTDRQWRLAWDVAIRMPAKKLTGTNVAYECI